MTTTVTIAAIVPTFDRLRWRRCDAVVVSLTELDIVVDVSVMEQIYTCEVSVNINKAWPASTARPQTTT